MWLVLLFVAMSVVIILIKFAIRPLRTLLLIVRVLAFFIALGVGIVSIVASAPFAIGFLHTYPVLSGSLVAYAVSTIVCVALTMMNKTKRFDFALIKQRTGDFDTPEAEAIAAAERAVKKTDAAYTGKER